MPSRVALLIVVFLLACSACHEASAQHFGKNKVEYVDFDFHVLETEHFALYYYPEAETGARLVARLAERWYARLSRVLDHRLEGRQPLILYGSQPEFAQTNVVEGFLGEGVGGVTESARRRIVMPFAPSLAETDRVLGHELTHAFQFDMARRYRGGMSWPLWAIEGLAQYLSLGSSDVETAMWLRDAVIHELLPERQDEAAAKFSPYRYGHALWAYLAGRFGDGVIPEILKAKAAGTLPRRIKAVTGVELNELYGDWREAARETYGRPAAAAGSPSRAPLSGERSGGRLYLGPSLSPDGSQVVFFSERDRLSIDLFLADVSTGSIRRKLATTAASVRLESLQPVRSAGAWSPDGQQFVFGAIERGRAALVLVDMRRPGRQREIVLSQFGQVLGPSWSPDGRSIAFSGLRGGLTNLYVYSLETGLVTPITDGPFMDLHPSWSPDGARLVFVTDRFSTDLRTLHFGRSEIAVAEVHSGRVYPLSGIDGSDHFNPQWCDGGASICFIAAPGGISNIYRRSLASGTLFQVTAVEGGVAGLTRTSPAFSIARDAHVLAFTHYREGKYHLETRHGAGPLAGDSFPATEGADVALFLPGSASGGRVDRALADSVTGLPSLGALQPRSYVPSMFLEALGSPYVSTGGGPFGSFVRGGGSFLFSDLLGQRKIGVAVQAGNHLRDVAVRVQFLNRERRWNWGLIAEAQPSLRRLPRSWFRQADSALTSETHYFERTEIRLAGLVAYPLDRAQRFEFQAGARHNLYRQRVNEVVRAVPSGRVLARAATDTSSPPATALEASAAFVRDTAVFGPVGPVLGARSRVGAGSALGELPALSLLIDHRRYDMPVKPYTIATRIVHLGHYAGDAQDPRWLPMFLGSREFLRGYEWGSIRCEPNRAGECTGYHELLGRRVLVANLEVRAPLAGIRSGELHYGPLPIEGFVFVDAGLAWSRAPEFSAARGDRHLVRSVGAGLRVNAFGLPLEWAVVRATDHPSPGWSFGLSLRPAF